MTEGRIVIIPFLHGKLDADGSLIEPDIDDILEKWLQRHPEFRGRKFHTIRGRMTLMTDDDSIDTDLVRVTVDFSPDLEHYDPAEDADLYEEFLADEGLAAAEIPQDLDRTMRSRRRNRSGLRHREGDGLLDW